MIIILIHTIYKHLKKYININETNNALPKLTHLGYIIMYLHSKVYLWF